MNRTSSRLRRSPWRRLLAVTAGVVGLLVASTSTARAAAAWTAPTVLAPSGAGNSFPVAATNGATSVVAWNQPPAVDAAVYTGSGWTTTVLTSGTGTATVDGAAVSPAGEAVVIVNDGSGALATRTFSGGTWSATDLIPGGAGFTVYSGAGFDAAGNLQVAVAAPTGSGAATRYDLETLVRTAAGVWQPPVTLTAGGQVGYPRMFMNGSGQAVVDSGFLVWRSPSVGVWGAPVNIAKQNYGQIFGFAAGLDQGGRAYVVFHSHYLGAFLATSGPDGFWTGPKRFAKADALGSDLHVTGSSGGHAVIYGVDWSTTALRATSTADGGASWGPLQTLPQSKGAGNGLISGDGGLYTATYTVGRLLRTSSGDGSTWAAPTVLPGAWGFGVSAMSGTHAVAAWVSLLLGGQMSLSGATAVVSP